VTLITTHLRVILSSLCWDLTLPTCVQNLTTIASAHQNLNGSRDLTTPLSVMICYPWTSTCCDQPTYQIWTLYLHPLRRYKRRYKIL